MKFLYVQLPALNRGEFYSLDLEMKSRGIRVEHSELSHGGRIYRVPIDDLNKLPKDEDGHYFGDSNSGHSFSSLDDLYFEGVRTKSFGSDWTPTEVTEGTRPQLSEDELLLDILRR